MMPADNVYAIHTLKTLLSEIVHVSVADDREVRGLSLDSRAVRDGFIFFALAGTQQHGLHYAQQALNNGACAVVWEQTDDASNIDVLFPAALKQHVPFYSVNKLHAKVGAVAEKFYAHPSRKLNMIGITGTNGKTSCSQFLAHVISRNSTCAVIGTLGNGLYGDLRHGTHTTPDAVTLHGMLNDFVSAGASHCSMEVSSHALDQGRVAAVEFDTAVFTNLSRDHLDYHGDMHAYSAAKRLLFEMASVKSAVINADDAFGRQLLQDLGGACELTAYSLKREPQQDIVNRHGKPIAWVNADNIHQDLAGLAFDIHAMQDSVSFAVPIMGRFNVANILAVSAVLLGMRYKLKDVAAHLRGLRTVDGRMQRTAHYPYAPLVVVDYAHTPDALEKALLALREHVCGEGTRVQRLWCVFGCGGDRDQGKRPRMGEVAVTFADRVVVTDDNPRTESGETIINEILSGIAHPANVTVIQDRAQAIKFAIENAAHDDVILLAGKGHEAYQILGREKRAYDGDFAVAQSLLGVLSNRRQAQ